MPELEAGGCPKVSGMPTMDVKEERIYEK